MEGGKAGIIFSLELIGILKVLGKGTTAIEIFFKAAFNESTCTGKDEAWLCPSTRDTEVGGPQV